MGRMKKVLVTAMLIGSLTVAGISGTTLARAEGNIGGPFYRLAMHGGGYGGYGQSSWNCPGYYGGYGMMNGYGGYNYDGYRYYMHNRPYWHNYNDYRQYDRGYWPRRR
ncbi:hypothetical protein [Thermodesulforhabdus norvegica]|uniref:Sulfur globule protein n=1 Tax=Thermodesulforhabdus norvegica TaxID=39841 RepID=A0A1I4QXS1_9BACT|nr:hypothetical protein [Thermodesulforhabdus norvegica]SFM44797.1 hypothetical protein SAMN05660836_00282 [Thermodesulforhabdus norvegica]